MLSHEVGHHIQAGEFGQQGGVVELERVAHAVRLAGQPLRLVAHRLAVGADGLDWEAMFMAVTPPGTYTPKAAPAAAAPVAPVAAPVAAPAAKGGK